MQFLLPMGLGLEKCLSTVSWVLIPWLWTWRRGQALLQWIVSKQPVPVTSTPVFWDDDAAIFKWFTPVVTICMAKAWMLWHQNKNGCWETEQSGSIHGHLCQYCRMLSNMSITQPRDTWRRQLNEAWNQNSCKRKPQTPTLKGDWNNDQPLQLLLAMLEPPLAYSSQGCQAPVEISSGVGTSLPHESLVKPRQFY